MSATALLLSNCSAWLQSAAGLNMHFTSGVVWKNMHATPDKLQAGLASFVRHICVSMVVVVTTSCAKAGADVILSQADSAKLTADLGNCQIVKQPTDAAFFATKKHCCTPQMPKMLMQAAQQLSTAQHSSLTKSWKDLVLAQDGYDFRTQPEIQQQESG